MFPGRGEQSKEGDPPRPASSAHERQRHALVDHRVGDHRDVDHRLAGNEESNTASQQATFDVGCAGSDPHRAKHDDDERDEHTQGEEQSQFFSDNREDEVGVLFRNGELDDSRS